MYSREPLVNPRLKIERANTHIRALEEAIQVCSRSCSYTIVEEVDRSGEFKVVKIRITQPIPDEIDQIGGDVISNLRAALDQITCELAIINKRGVSGVYFPTADTVQEFEKLGIQEKIEKLSPKAIELIRKLEPYGGGSGEAFWLLGKLEAVNKHRRFVPIGYTSKGVLAKSLIARGRYIIHNGAWDFSDESLPLFTVFRDGEINYGIIKPNLNVSFRDIPVLQGQSIVSFFTQVASDIEKFRLECKANFFDLERFL